MSKVSTWMILALISIVCLIWRVDVQSSEWSETLSPLTFSRTVIPVIAMTPPQPSRATSLSPERVDRSLEEQLQDTVRKCNEDVKNNPAKHSSCILLKDAVIDRDIIYAPREENSDVVKHLNSAGQFPVVGKTRYQMKPISVQLYTKDHVPSLINSAKRGATIIAYFQSPVIGALYANVWHTIADFYLMMFHTIYPLFHSDSKYKPLRDVTWFSRSPFHQLNKGCKTRQQCRAMSLFDPFQRLFKYMVMTHDMTAPLQFPFLLVGINSRCSPVPTENVNIPACQNALRGMRNFLLSSYGLPVDRTITAKEKECPHVHIMSRQKDKYRRITPFDEMVQKIRRWVSSRHCEQATVAVVSLHGGVPFSEQVRSVANSTILIAGRGGGTTLSIFLPVGGVYLSISGSDQWNPFRDLVPHWIHLRHYEAKLVHHGNPQLPPQKFYGSADPNRAGYLVEPEMVVRALQNTTLLD